MERKRHITSIFGLRILESNLLSRGALWPRQPSESSAALPIYPSYNGERHLIHDMPSSHQALHLIPMPARFHHPDGATSLPWLDCVLQHLRNAMPITYHHGLPASG